MSNTQTHRRANPMQAHHLRVAFLEATSSQAFRAYSGRYADSAAGRVQDGAARSARGRAADEDGASLTAHLSRTARAAHTFYVSPAMEGVVTAATESMPDDLPVVAQDFPTDFGWLYVPHGITELDVRGGLCTTSVIMWTRTGPTVRVDLLADAEHPLDRLGARGAADPSLRLLPWHTTTVTFGEPLPLSYGLDIVLPPEEADQVRFTTGPNGQVAMFHPRGYTPEQMTPSPRVDGAVKWLVACLRVMDQPRVVDLTTRGLPAGVRRAMASRHVRVKDSTITVIEFRRSTVDPDAEPGTGERRFSHRFLRRGHWRRQWTGTERAGDRRQVLIWIHPTLVGDESLPLLNRHHIMALTR